MLSKMACTSSVDSLHIAGDSIDSEALCLSSTLGYISPRISFSNDFAQHKDDGTQDVYESREIGDMDSVSEFEFSMSMPDRETVNGGVMLPADELFCNGKLLPLYIPQRDKRSNHSSLREFEEATELSHVTQKGGYPQQMTGCSTVASSSGDSIIAADHCPLSPKAPNCSARLRDLFGFRKVQAQRDKEAVPSEAGPKQGMPSQNKPAPPKPLKLLLKSSDGKPPDACFTHVESLLVPRVTEPNASPPSFSTPRQSQPLDHHSTPSHDQSVTIPLLSFPLESGFNFCNSFLSKPVGMDLQQADLQKSMTNEISKSNPIVVDACPKGNTDSCGAPIMRNRSFSSPGSFARPTSPGKKGSMVLRRRSGDVSPGRSSAAAVGPPRPISTGGGSSEGQVAKVASGRTMPRQLERSSSSPKSLRKKQDQFRGMRQRDGWKGLERSSSYCASVRVTPVLNVPVCISPSLRGGRGSSNGIFGFGQFFSSKKERSAKMLSAASFAKSSQVKMG